MLLPSKYAELTRDVTYLTKNEGLKFFSTDFVKPSQIIKKARNTKCWSASRTFLLDADMTCDLTAS